MSTRDTESRSSRVRSFPMMARTVGLLAALLAGCVAEDRDAATDSRDPRALAGGTGAVLDLERIRLVDLSHAFDENTVYWPTSPSRFELDTLSYGDTPGGYFYSAFTIATPEHGGTHLDAPIHFARGGDTADRVPLDRLVAPAVVIDIGDAAAADPDYMLSVQDVQAFEAEHGRVPENAIVLLRTGWDARWPDAAAYLGDDTPGDASNLHFPSFGEESARLLVEERGAAALGADVASIDSGRSTDFPVHRLAMARNVPGLENLANLSELPPTGALVVALPMKIAGGSGGPLRAIALVPR
ncbi:MAG TPA: cyclase family protein [Longimicrobiales bacterium]|nr:cyclase family protein [Longimicrobiales bacterium]